MCIRCAPKNFVTTSLRSVCCGSSGNSTLLRVGTRKGPASFPTVSFHYPIPLTCAFWDRIRRSPAPPRLVQPMTVYHKIQWNTEQPQRNRNPTLHRVLKELDTPTAYRRTLSRDWTVRRSEGDQGYRNQSPSSFRQVSWVV